MKLPRDLSGEDLVKALAGFEYVVDRQSGSHIRLTTQLNGEHHITIPAHNPLDISGKHLYGFKLTQKPNPLTPFPTREGRKLSLSPCRREVWREVFSFPEMSIEGWYS